MSTQKSKIARYYETEKSAKFAAHKLNKEKGKNVYVVLEEKSGGWIVIHINQLL